MVADTHHFNAEPDPDPAFHFNADPDPTPLQSDRNLQLMVYRIDPHGSIFSLQASIVSVHGPPRLYIFEPLKLLVYEFNADPDSASKNNADPLI